MSTEYTGIRLILIVNDVHIFSTRAKFHKTYKITFRCQNIARVGSQRVDTDRRQSCFKSHLTRDASGAESYKAINLNATYWQHGLMFLHF